MSGTVVIIAGLSGAGKTTVAEFLCKSDPRFCMSRSHTTRAPRGDGRDAEYIYVSEDEFSRLVESGELVEHTRYSEVCYGTSRTELYGIINDGKVPVLVLDYNGIVSIKKCALFKCVIAIYLYADFDTVDTRLYNRTVGDNPTPEKLKTYEMRTKVNVSDSLDMPNRAEQIDAFIKNDSLDDCVKSVMDLVCSHEKGSVTPYSERLRIAEQIRAEVITRFGL